MRLDDVACASPVHIAGEDLIYATEAGHDALPALADGQVLVFVTFTDAMSESDLMQASDALSLTERERCAAFVFDRDRRLFATARALLRRLIGHYAQIPAESIEFVLSEFGKPYLPSARGLTFNVTHSRGCVAVVIARDMPVGVDVESMIEPRDDLVEIAAEVCSTAELAWIARAPVDRRAECFLKLWTLKESYVKAIGVGMTKPLKECNFAFAESGDVVFRDTAHDMDVCKTWHFAQYVLRGSFHLAVAMLRRPGLLSLWQLDASGSPRVMIPMGAAPQQ